MTKEEYLHFRTNDPFQLLYEKYKEKFDKEKHKQFLQYSEFMHFLSIWTPNIGALLHSTISEYDKKFELI